MQLYDHGVSLQKKEACCAGQDIYAAQMVANCLGIPHYVLNYESLFKQSVMDDFSNSYLRGETPIPCVKCNQTVKFRDLLKIAKDLGANRLATGHYVRKKLGKSGPELHTRVDVTKDQNYFLFTTTLEQLDFTEFPLGSMEKNETRQLALKYGLEVADKPDSQDICFVPNSSYTQVIERLQSDAIDPYEIIHSDDRILGQHNDIINYTIGQRCSLQINFHEPLYVVMIDPTTNRIILGVISMKVKEHHHTHKITVIRNLSKPYTLGFTF